jgi:sodium/potassium-transporting ATPase subunit alpha
MSSGDKDEYVQIVRRLSGAKFDGRSIELAARKDNKADNNVKLVGDAEVGVIEATRRLSGVRAAIIEAKSVENATTNDDKYGLGSKPWHSMTDVELFAELGTRESGLSSSEALEKEKIHGKNQITPPKTTHWFVKFLLTLIGGFQLMLWFGSILCFIVYGLTKGTDVQILALAIVLILVVFVTSIFQAYQEGKSDAVMAELKKLSPSTCFAYRDGEIKSIDAIDLVPGDIVKVVGGEKVPADVRVLSSSDLKVNNASLTGENVDIKLSADANSKTLYEAKNIARSGCNFTSGSAVCIVFATGDHTFFGKIAKSVTSSERPETLMKHEIHRLINIMAIVAFALGIAFFILAFYNGYTWVEAVIFMIGIIVANVPEGLLPQMTVALTLTAQRMLKLGTDPYLLTHSYSLTYLLTHSYLLAYLLTHLGVLVSNLEIIETLGAVDVICSDKTGTLTENRMSVSHIMYNKTIFIHKLTTSSLEGDTFPFIEEDSTSFKALQRIATLNTDAFFLAKTENDPDVLKRETKGDASESAIIKFVEPIRKIKEYRDACKRHVAIPFNSSNKWMLAIHEQEGPDKGTHCHSPNHLLTHLTTYSLTHLKIHYH